MNLKYTEQLSHKMQEGFCVFWGGCLLGYWISYILGSQNGILVVTPEQVLYFSIAAIVVIATRSFSWAYYKA